MSEIVRFKFNRECKKIKEIEKVCPPCQGVFAKINFNKIFSDGEFPQTGIFGALIAFFCKQRIAISAGWNIF